MKLSSILTILDKPKDQQLALKRAKELSELGHAELDCLAFTWHPIAEMSDVFSTEERGVHKKSLIASRQKEAKQAFAEAEVASNTHLKTIWSKDLATQVAAELAKKPRDLVVKTVHNTKTLAHTPLDWELLRTCPSPVLLTTHTKRRRSGRIVATLDLLNDDNKHRMLNLRVLDAASYMATLHQAELHVVAVTPMSQVMHDLEIIDERKLQRRTNEATAAYLESVLQRIEPLKLKKNQVHRPVGKVGSTVQRVARELKADLMVVGRSTRKMRQAFGLGGTAEQILMQAECEVLAVH